MYALVTSVPLRTCPVSSNAYIPSVQTKRLEAVKGVRVGSCGRILRSVPVLQPLLCARTQPAQSRSTITTYPITVKLCSAGGGSVLQSFVYTARMSANSYDSGVKTFSGLTDNTQYDLKYEIFSPTISFRCLLKTSDSSIMLFRLASADTTPDGYLQKFASYKEPATLPEPFLKLAGRPIRGTCKLSVCDVTTQGSTEEEPKLARHPTFSILQISALVQESALDLKGALLLGMLLIPVEPAEAALINNVPEWAQNIFGFLYLAFFGAFIIRVFRKRAKFATTTRLADEKQEKTEEEIAAEQKKIDQLTPLDTFGGAFVAYSLASIFYAVSVKIDDGFARQPLPADYSIQQITITIRTIVSGLAYLATFVFGANATGLAALGVQLIYKQLTGQLDQDDEPLSGKKVEEKLTSEPETEGDTAPTTLEAYLAKKEKDEANKSVK